MIKNGEQHRASLRDGRQVYLKGAVVDDVTTHRAFRRSVDSVCRLYDFQSKPKNAELMTYEVADTTPRPLIRKKAVAAAEEMMKLMLTLEVESDDRE